MSELRGNPNDLRQRPTTRASDVPFTGPGYFGTVYLADDPKCYSVNLETTCRVYSTRDTDPYPLLVPTLTRAEITHLVAGGMPTLEIFLKAQGHAAVRAHRDQSAFAQLDEPMLPLPEEEG